MGLAEELDQLARLHAAGGLTDDEWAAAKAHLLTGSTTSDTATDAPPASGPSTGPGMRRSGPRWWWAVVAGVIVAAAVTGIVVATRGDEHAAAPTTVATTTPGTTAPATTTPAPTTAPSTSAADPAVNRAVCADVQQTFDGSVLAPIRDLSNQGFLGFFDGASKRPGALDVVQQAILDAQTELHVQQAKPVSATVQAALADLDAAYAQTHGAVLAKDGLGFAHGTRAVIDALKHLAVICAAS